MSGSGEIQFPQFVLEDGCWTTRITLPAWTGFIADDDEPGAESDSGSLEIVYAPDERDDSPIDDREKELIRWVIEHQQRIHDAAMDGIMQQYPKLREIFREWLDEDEWLEVMPPIQTASELKKLLYVPTIYIHQLLSVEPYLGLSINCEWDMEHGLGVVMHGSKVLEVGEASSAFTIWEAEKYVKKSS